MDLPELEPGVAIELLEEILQLALARKRPQTRSELCAPLAVAALAAGDKDLMWRAYKGMSHHWYYNYLRHDIERQFFDIAVRQGDLKFARQLVRRFRFQDTDRYFELIQAGDLELLSRLDRHLRQRPDKWVDLKELVNMAKLGLPGYYERALDLIDADVADGGWRWTSYIPVAELAAKRGQPGLALEIVEKMEVGGWGWSAYWGMRLYALGRLHQLGVPGAHRRAYFDLANADKPKIKVKGYAYIALYFWDHHALRRAVRELMAVDNPVKFSEIHHQTRLSGVLADLGYLDLEFQLLGRTPYPSYGQYAGLAAVGSKPAYHKVLELVELPETFGRHYEGEAAKGQLAILAWRLGDAAIAHELLEQVRLWEERKARSGEGGWKRYLAHYPELLAKLAYLGDNEAHHRLFGLQHSSVRRTRQVVSLALARLEGGERRWRRVLELSQEDPNWRDPLKELAEAIGDALMGASPVKPELEAPF